MMKPFQFWITEEALRAFFRNLKVLEKYNLNWTIVEQEQLVTAGQEKLAKFNQISF